MGEVRHLDLELSEQLATDIDQAIQSGAYSDLNDVLSDALTVWAATRDQRNARLRALIQEGLASGDPRDVTDAWFESVKERGLARLAERRLAG